jgi:hypothetical protein
MGRVSAFSLAMLLFDIWSEHVRGVERRSCIVVAFKKDLFDHLCCAFYASSELYLPPSRHMVLTAETYAAPSQLISPSASTLSNMFADHRHMLVMDIYTSMHLPRRNASVMEVAPPTAMLPSNRGMAR